MNQTLPRLRMFAGPNGSGKSTLKGKLDPNWLGIYVNADDVERDLRENHHTLDLTAYGIEATPEEVMAFFRGSSLLAKKGMLDVIASMTVQGTHLSFSTAAVNSYVAAVLVDFIRTQLVALRATVSFETVMSGPDKVEFFCSARQRGYRTYLYYVATEDPLINIERVKQRVEQGGHPVPSEKVIERYHRSLDKLWDAIRCSDRAYIWDNSGQELELLAEFNQGEMDLKVADVPVWFNRAVLIKLNESEGDDTLA